MTPRQRAPTGPKYTDLGQESPVGISAATYSGQTCRAKAKHPER